MKRVALVIGAAGGVGLEVVKQLLKADYEVIGTVLNPIEAAQLTKTVGAIKDIVELDLTNADNVVTTLKSRIKQIDAVVVCAAISPYGPLEITPLAQLRKTLEINTISAVAVYQACMPLLRISKGRLVLISSFAGRVGLPPIGHYVASKFALEGLGDVMRREAKPWDVDVIVVEPGGIKTPMVTGQIASIGKDRAALTKEQAALYGDLFDTFAALLNKGWETGLDPSIVAAQIVEALQSKTPQARYQVGDDSKFLCNVAAKQSEQEQDAIVAGLLSSL